MARKGTRVERLIAVSVGFITYGIIYLLAYSAFDGDTLTPFYLGLVWLGSVGLGVVAAFVTALTILRYRK